MEGAFDAWQISHVQVLAGRSRLRAGGSAIPVNRVGGRTDGDAKRLRPESTGRVVGVRRSDVAEHVHELAAPGDLGQAVIAP
jgi:hypothetical protein